MVPIVRKDASKSNGRPGRWGFAGCLITVFVLIPAAASTAAPPSWTPGATIALPLQASGESSVLTSVSCWGAGNCEAVGTFLSKSGLIRPMAVNDNGGRWGQAEEIELPSNATMPAHFNRLSCSQPGWCGAAGSYEDTSSRVHPIVASERDGVWGHATEVQLPNPGELEQPAQPLIRSVSCVGTGSCVAVGTYIEAPENYKAFVLRSAEGMWESTADVLTTPGKAEEKPRASLESVACWAPGSCTAVGQYRQSFEGPFEGRAVFRPMGITELAGTWQPAADVDIASNREVGSNLTSVACGAAGACEAVGALYENGSSFPLVAAGANGRWGTPYETGPPPGAEPGTARLLQIACIDERTCAAIGEYRARYGNHFGMFASGTIEALSAGQAITDPLSSSGSDESSLYRISCTSGPLCETLGEYRDEETFDEPMFLAETGSPWAPTPQVPQAPPGATSDTAELSSVSCAGGACVAVGAAPGPTGWLPTVFSAGNAEAPSMPLAPPTPQPIRANASPLTVGSGPLSVQSASGQPVGGVLGTKVTVSRLRFSPRRQAVYASCPHGTCHGRLKLVRRTRTRKHGRWLTSSVLLARATYDLHAGEHAWIKLVPTHSGRALLARMRSPKHVVAHLVIVAG